MSYNKGTSKVNCFYFHFFCMKQHQTDGFFFSQRNEMLTRVCMLSMIRPIQCFQFFFVRFLFEI